MTDKVKGPGYRGNGRMCLVLRVLKVARAGVVDVAEVGGCTSSLLSVILRGVFWRVVRIIMVLGRLVGDSACSIFLLRIVRLHLGGFGRWGGVGRARWMVFAAVTSVCRDILNVQCE